jgi:hypothetical protein
MSPPTNPYPGLKQFLFFSLSLAPAAFLAVLIFKYSVDLPQWDEWSYVPFFEKLSHGSLTFGDLFAQVNEYRQFFPNLVMVAVGWLTRWDPRYEMLVTFLVACFISFTIYRLCERTIVGDRTSGLLLFLIANLIIFSPAQYENWLQGQQLVYFIPIACVTTCLLVAYSGLNAPARFGICAVLSLVSTFSSANGIVCWLVVLPVLMLAESSSRLRARWWIVLGWIVGLVCSAALYLHDYHKPWWSPKPSMALSHPTVALDYFLAFVGAPLALSNVKLAVAMGLIMTSAYGLSCYYLFKRRADLPLVRRMLIWSMIGAYSLLTALMTTFGRLGLGIAQSQNTRYIGFSAFLLVALVFLLRIINQDLASRSESGRQSIWVRWVTVGLAGILLALQPFIFALSIDRMRKMKMLLLEAKASVLFINLKPEPVLIRTLYPDVKTLTQQANVLDGLGFLRPSLIRTLKMEEFAAPSQSNPADYGSWNQLTSLEDGNRYRASGWASLPYRGEVADAVILSYQTAGGETLMFEMTRPREKLAEVWYRKRDQSETWQVWFSADQLPAQPVTLTAWAFDANSGKAFRLDGEFQFPASDPKRPNENPSSTGLR